MIRVPRRVINDSCVKARLLEMRVDDVHVLQRPFTTKFSHKRSEVDLGFIKVLSVSTELNSSPKEFRPEIGLLLALLLRKPLSRKIPKSEVGQW